MSNPRRYYLEIFLVSFAALLLEISYTRVISFKLFYYYTYLIIGFALLGIGSGAVFVSISARLRGLDETRLLARCCVAGAIAVGVGYFVIALTPLHARDIWAGSAVATNLAAFFVICAGLFATFLAVGVIVATLFSRHPESINRLYFADLLGAGLACALVVPALKLLSPPGCVFLGGLVLAVTGARLAMHVSRGLFYTATAVALLLAVGAAAPGLLPDPVTDEIKTIRPGVKRMYTEWSPVFRVDLTGHPLTKDVRIIHHDGLWGSTLHRFDGDVSGLQRFDKDERSYPFRVLEDPPANVLIIGAAGGHEILASLYFRAGNINAVELNPVTISLITTHFADWSGRLHEHPAVNLINDEGRSYLARDETSYDLIFFVAPDSYSAQNAATAGAFVLSESYLYTSEMIVESLEHLTDDGVVCMQFGEFSYDRKPNRTTRYVGTARKALEGLGIAEPGRHILVATSPSFIPVSTILLKRTPFTKEEVDRFLATSNGIEGAISRHAWGHALEDGAVNKAITLTGPALEQWYDDYPYEVRPISDDAPFFWHFARFRSVMAEFNEVGNLIDTEDSIGERLMLLMVAIAVLFASVFLLLPFVAIREKWARLPRKLPSALYFAALGLGFMFFEICLIQKLTLFLGYPTYSLTVTLMSLLVFTALGSLATTAYMERRNAALIALLGAIAVLTLFYQFGMGVVTDRFLGTPLGVRIAVAVLFMAPLGLCLGAFMPLGLMTVSGLSEYADEYVAWGWAVNGFFSVIGSVLTTILSMGLGFRVVLLLGLLTYAVATFTLWRLPQNALRDR